MIAFWLTAAAMLLVGMAVILPPMLQRAEPERAERETSEEEAAMIAIYRERLADLDREYERDHISEADYAAAQAEAKRELLQYVPEERSARARSGANRWATAITAIAVPAIALAVYAASGRPDLVASDRADRLNPEQVTRYAQMPANERIPRLEAYLEQYPAAPRAWSLLASAYRSEKHFQSAAEAYSRAIRAGQTTDARLIARQAESLLLANDRRFTEDVQDLIDASLQADPRNPLGLMLAGHAALTRGQDAEAAAYWQRLAEQIPEDDRRRQLVDALIARAQGETGSGDALASAAAADPESGADADVADEQPTIVVRLQLGEALRDQARRGETVFIFARAADAQGGPPLAVQRTTVAALPIEVELSDAQAMVPGRTLSSAERIVVTARVSRNGDVTATSGDFEGRSEPLPTDRREAVEVTIDRRLE